MKVTSATQSTQAKKKSNPKYKVQTSHGDFEIELYPRKAPITVKNFIRYVEAGHYAGTIFQRVIKDFMIQGGNFTPDMKKKRVFSEIKNEADNGLKNKQGTLAMARRDDPDSAADQFFINLVDNAFLDHTSKKAGYTVFGKVTRGFDVVKKIGNSKVNENNEPREPVIINKIIPLSDDGV
ncbi:MAG: peptidylprolyl isomerase [Verrucomicrobia bacterium]|nr:peptidylprolyl isomerase [Verrucomicrobiota bacterium]